MKIQPTSWNKLKTEVINFSEDFLWLDDELFPEELEALKKHNAENKFVKINLQKNKYQLKDIIYSGVFGNPLFEMWWLGDRICDECIPLSKNKPAKTSTIEELQELKLDETPKCRICGEKVKLNNFN